MVTTEQFNALIDQVSRLVALVAEQATMIHNLTLRLDRVADTADAAYVAAHWDDPAF